MEITYFLNSRERSLEVMFLCSDSLYEDEEELDEEGEDGSSYLDPSRLGATEANNNLSPGSPAGLGNPPDKSPSRHQQADSSTERDPNDSEGKLPRFSHQFRWPLFNIALILHHSL
jgi:hypothetical protein